MGDVKDGEDGINELQRARDIVEGSGGRDSPFEKILPHLALDVLEVMEMEKKPGVWRIDESLLHLGLCFYRMRRAFGQPMTTMAMECGDRGASVMVDSDGVKLADKFRQVMRRLAWMDLKMLKLITEHLPQSTSPKQAVMGVRTELHHNYSRIAEALAHLKEIVDERDKAKWVEPMHQDWQPGGERYQRVFGGKPDERNR